jgi:retron-type reverse transcriptase
MTETLEAKLPDWDGIASEGGTDEWVRAELRRRGLLDEGTDTSRLSDKEKKNYKARREEERRVKRVLEKHAWAEYKKAHLVHVGVGIFHHDTPDIDRFDIEDPSGRLEKNELPKIADVKGLSQALELSVARLRWLVYHREVDSGTHYHRWIVPKRDGRPRLISAPKPDLKRCQAWIAEKITEHLPVHGAAHGFLGGRSTVTNATAHVGAKVVVKLDLEDFYPTITTPRVKGMFRKAGYGEQVAAILALLVTESPREQIAIEGKTYHVAVGSRSLPQGAPTSPSITNAVCLRLDTRLAKMAQKLGFRYTRYADDLTFSWHQQKEAPVGQLLRIVNAIVADEGFTVHRKKTRIMRSGRRQKVTGLVVNQDGPVKRARVPRTLVRQIRAGIKNRELGRQGKETLDQLRGLAAYVYMCDPKRGKEFLARIDALEEKQ